MSSGFVVTGSEVRDTLHALLSDMGLNTKERSDFIMFWYPKLQHYPYVQITFAGKEYEHMAPLKITPKPDSLLRVFMLAKPLDTYKEIPKQEIIPFNRNGFSVVEWGGMMVE